MANGHKCSSFVPPGSLKELLDFFAALADGKNGNCNVTNATKAVLEELKNRLKGEDDNGWIRKGNGNENGGADFFYRDANGKGKGCVMPKTILRLRELRTKILKDENKNNNPYTLPDSSHAANDPCVKKYADAIIQNAFPLFGCLFYLWFMCDNGAQSIRKNGTGSDFTGWKEQQLDGNGGSGSSNNLNKFLKDQQPTAEQLKKRMLTRGYNGELKSTQGQQLFNTGNERVVHLANSGGPLQQALYFLLFLAPRWHPAMSGHALLFLDWFNNKASSVFQNVQWLHVKEAGERYFKKNCKGNGLEDAIKALAGDGNGPNIAPVHRLSIGASGSGQEAACNLYFPNTDSNGSNGKHKHTGNGCKSILHDKEHSFKNGQNDNDKKSHVFMQYVSWLWWCIPHLTESLRAMQKDSGNWNDNGGTNNFKESKSFGPFAFGFTFTDDKWQNGNGASELQQKLQKLISGIDQFKCCIERFFWAIRRPFACGSLAAWILAFIFLFYVNLLPLDLFHLKSHLLASSSFYRSDVIHSTLISNVTDVSYFKIF